MNEDVRELLAGYVDGELSEEQRQAFEAELARNPEQRREGQAELVSQGLQRRFLRDEAELDGHLIQTRAVVLGPPRQVQLPLVEESSFQQDFAGHPAGSLAGVPTPGLPVLRVGPNRDPIPR